jgi:uncharacterized membrane protein YccC
MTNRIITTVIGFIFVLTGAYLITPGLTLLLLGASLLVFGLFTEI